MTSTFSPTNFIKNVTVLRSGIVMTKPFTLKSEDNVMVLVTTAPDCLPIFDSAGNAPFSPRSSNTDTTWQVVKTSQVLYLPGENVLLHLVEKKGKGLLVLHVIGLVNLKNTWHIEHTKTEIQLYAKKKGFFTTAFKNNKEVQDQLKWMVHSDTDVPLFSTYVEVAPKMNAFIWVNPWNGSGALMTPQGQAFVHRKDIKVGHETCFKPGVEVTFELVPSEGAFAWKAINVAYPSL